MALAPAITINLPGYPFSNLTAADTFAALRAISSADLADKASITVNGADATGDGLGGIFVWSDGSLAADDDANVIRPTDTAPGNAGRWLRGYVSIGSAELAATTAGKGASLVGTEGGGTVQDFITTLSTETVGTLPSGPSGSFTADKTVSGAGAGNSVYYGLTWRVHADGGNNYSTVRNSYYGTDIETTAGTVNVAEGSHTYVWLHGAGNVNYARIVSAHLRLDGNGGIAQNAYYFNCVDLTLGGGTGIINQVTGFDIGQIGHATRVTNVVGVSVGALASSGSAMAYYSNVAAGASKWNLYLEGTADNLIEGNIRFGATSRVATGTGGITWATNVAPGSTGIQIQEWAKVLGAGGALRYIPLLS